MDLDDLRANWDRFGRDDPRWAALTVPAKRHGSWDDDEFYDTGVAEVQAVLKRLDDVVRRTGIHVTPDGDGGRALDFGCGVGRLTLALADRFERCDGVDIAPSMIEGARAFASGHPHGGRCSFHLIEDDLSEFGDGSFDLVYSTHVLQHMEPHFARAYVAEFIRVLRPGGAVFFHIPTVAAPVPAAPLPPEGRRATVVIHDTPSEVRAGATVPLRLTVTNTGGHVWPAFSSDGHNRVEVVQRWRPRFGPVRTDDRAPVGLGQDLPGGDHAPVALSTTAPRRPGRWTLEVDVAQDSTGWFSGSGGSPASAEVRVTLPVLLMLSTAARRGGGHVLRRLRRTPAGPTVDRIVRRARRRATTQERPEEGRREGGPVTPEIEAAMEMHGSSIEEISDWVRVGGGRVLDVVDWCELTGKAPSTDWTYNGFIVSRAD